MQGAPFTPSLDPHGLFNAWKALVYVTALAAVFLPSSVLTCVMTFGSGVMKRPILGSSGRCWRSV
jgi:hypothetical protein